MYRKPLLPTILVPFLIASLFLMLPSDSTAKWGSKGGSKGHKSGGSKSSKSYSGGSKSSKSHSGGSHSKKSWGGGSKSSKSLGGGSHNGWGGSNKSHSSKKGHGGNKSPFGWGGGKKSHYGKGKHSSGKGKHSSGKGKHGGKGSGHSSSGGGCKWYEFWCSNKGSSGGSSGKGDGKGGDQQAQVGEQQANAAASQVNAAEAAAEAADPVNGAAGSSTPDEDRIAVTPPAEEPGDGAVPTGDTEEETEEAEPEPVPMKESVFQSGAVMTDYGATGAPSVGRGRSYGAQSASVDASLVSAKLGASVLDKKFGYKEISAKGMDTGNREVAGNALGANGEGVKINQIRAELDKNDPNRGDRISQRGQRALQAAESLHQMGDDEAALRQAEAAIRADGKSSLGYLAKAKALAGLGRYKEAERFAKLAEKRSRTRNTRSEALTLQAMVQEKQGRMNDAVASADMAKRLATGDRYLTNALATRAFLCEREKDRECLLDNLLKASEIDKTYERHYMLARQGKQVFNANATDASALMNAMGEVADEEGAPQERSKLWLLIPGLLMLGGFGATFRALRTEPSVKEMKEQLTNPVAAAAAAAAKQGPERLDGKYEMIKVIASKSTGQVWEAKDHSLDRTVAIKKLAVGEVADGEGSRAAFLEEARTLATMNHPNIQEIFAVLNQDDGLYIIGEMLDGQTIQQILDGQGVLPIGNAKRLLVDAAKGLHAAHERGIIHRDLTLERIVFSKTGFIKLTDFGTVKSAGALGYRAPESKPGNQSAQTDVYALGVCLHELAVGGKPPMNLTLDGVEPGLAGLLKDSLAADPENRLKSAAEFADRLQALAEVAAVA